MRQFHGRVLSDGEGHLPQRQQGGPGPSQKDVSRFDLVITDQTMPEMTGPELAKKILSIRSDMPIVLSTGFSHQVDAETAKQAGIKAFVMKPLVKREIAKTIRDVLDG